MTVLIICVVGGLGRVWGPLYGMLIVAAVQNALNKAGLSSTTAATGGHMIYDVIIIVAVAVGAVLRLPDNTLTRLKSAMSRRSMNQ